MSGGTDGSRGGPPGDDAERDARAALCEAIVEHAGDQVSVVDAAGRTVYANPAAVAAYGPATGEVEGVSFVHPDDLAAVAAANRALAARPGGTETVLCRLRRRDGSWLHAESVGVNLLDDPRVQGLLWVTRDVTERVRAERERDRQLAGQRLVAQLGLRSLRGEEPADLVRDALSGLRDVLGVDHVHLLDLEADGVRVREVVGEGHPGMFIPSERLVASPTALSLAQRGPFVGGDLVAAGVLPPPALQGLDVGASLVVLLDSPAAPTGAIAAHAGTSRRFTEGDVALAQAVANVLAGAADAAHRHAEASHRAMHDPLTGLANRALLEDRLTKALQRSAREATTVSLIFVDLDGFKAVNDTFGHEAGDLVLTALAERFRSHFRSADTVARLGGDEFVVLCADLPHPDEESLLTRVARVWEEPVPLPRERAVVPVRGAVGVATVAGPGHDAARVLALADSAMYRDKRRQEG